MSLVIRLMTTPAFSSVKKSSERRCRWRKTVIRRSFMTHEARRPGHPGLAPLGGGRDGDGHQVEHRDQHHDQPKSWCAAASCRG